MPERFNLGDLGLPEDSEIHPLLAACPDIEPVCFRDREYLIRAEPLPGDDAADADILLLLRGSCLAEHPGAPEERTPGHELAIIEGSPVAPAFVGEMAYLGGGYRTASVRSVMSTWALRLKPKHLDIILERFPGFTRILCGQFCGRLTEANELLKRYQADTIMEAERRFLAPDELLFAEGDAADRLYQLVEGVLMRSVGGAEEEIRPERGSGGEACGFIEPRPYFSNAMRASTVRAKSPAIVIGIAGNSKRAVVRNFPGLVLDLLSAG